ncbi:MAG TPA: metallophosphoesterase, partial [Streptomyces sp.]
MVEGSMTQGAGLGPEPGTSEGWRPETSEYGPFDVRGAYDTPAGYDEPGGYEAPVAHPPVTAHSTTMGQGTAVGYEPTQPDAPLVPVDYTPTARDLPVITDVDIEGGAGDRPGPLYVVGDVHGYLDELLAALRANGLVDDEGHWSAGSARLWFLGDFTDRGPDGIGVIELVMQLSAEAAAAGGYCRALMGNHELLLLGAHRFGDTPVNSTGGTASFLAAWRLNGGQPSDMERLEDRHLTWMSRLDAAHVTDGHLLMHSDTTAYLDYGSSVEEMNDAVTGVLQR